MHNDFFLIAATPVIKVFLMLEALRRVMLEAPSKPAMESNTVDPPGLLMNNELMIFLQDIQCFSMVHISY